MISVPLILWLLFIHWVGDAFLQDGKTAVLKSKSLVALTDHVTIYTTVLTIGASLWFGHEPVYSRRCLLILLFGLLNGALHWFTDFGTSKLNARLWVSGSATTPPNLYWFFVSVLADQFAHTSTILLTAYWLLTP